jgi:hypothetical protein
MKEALFIIFIVLVLFALTAVRYRKQISGVIGFARMLKDVKANIGPPTNTLPREPAKSIPLVNCSKCGVWVPQTKAIKFRDTYYCSEACLANAAG